MHELYRAVCRQMGHDLKVFTQMPAKMEKTIGTPGGIVLFTNTVSHSMMSVAIRVSRKKNIPVVRAHSSSKESLERAISALVLGGAENKPMV